jgi:uncharacterized protein
MWPRALPLLFATLSWDGHAQQQATRVRSLLEIRRENVVIQQWDASCGAAALATVLSYQHGVKVTERAVAEGLLGLTNPLRVRVRGGFSLLDLKRYADSLGFEANAYRSMTLDALQTFGVAIVPVNLHGFPHFVVFRQIAGDFVAIADPAFGNRLLPKEEFLKGWRDGIAFVVTNPKVSALKDSLSVRPSDVLQVDPGTIRTVLSQ